MQSLDPSIPVDVCVAFFGHQPGLSSHPAEPKQAIIRAAITSNRSQQRHGTFAYLIWTPAGTRRPRLSSRRAL